MTDTRDQSAGHALIVGASRGLGLALVGELARRGWRVTGTVRGEGGSALHALADRSSGAVRVETLDMTDADQIAALRARLSAPLKLLFVNAGTTAADANGQQAIGTVSTDEFNRVITTNARAPLRVIEALADLVPANGLIGAMSSGQGSIANNDKGGRELYRASKAALNMLMRSIAAREEMRSRALLLLAPGWISTDLGGVDAPYTVEESAPRLVDVLLAKRGRAGLEYLDRDGARVPW